MDDEANIALRKEMERKKALLLEEAAAKAAEAAKVDVELAEFAEYQRLAAKFRAALGAASNKPATSDAFDGTLAGLMDCYQIHKDSTFQPLRHYTKQNYISLIKRIKETAGTGMVAALTAADIRILYDGWTKDGTKIPMAHALITMLRTVVNFGALVLKDERCQRLAYVLHRMKFTVPKRRSSPLTADQAALIIKTAHAVGMHSVALAQAIQFYFKLGQKPTIGEWIPISDPGESKVVSLDGKMKWVRGISWENIDEHYVYRYVDIDNERREVPLHTSPSVMDAIRLTGGRYDDGPLVVSELAPQPLPWRAHEFRRQWRKIANACGIPKDVYNMDSRNVASDDTAAEEAEIADENFDEIEKDRPVSGLQPTSRVH